MMLIRFAVLAVLFVNLSACAPKVGSDDWCKDMAKQSNGDWSANEAADYAKHCVFKKLK